MYTYLPKICSEINFFILDTHNPDTLYLNEHGCEDPWLFSEAQTGPGGKNFWAKLR